MGMGLGRGGRDRWINVFFFFFFFWGGAFLERKGNGREGKGYDFAYERTILLIDGE